MSRVAGGFFADICLDNFKMLIGGAGWQFSSVLEFVFLGVLV